jgi:hypothetical protein
MYIIDSFTGSRAIQVAIAAAPFGAGFSSKDIHNMHSLQVLGTSMDDPYCDYCDFVVKDSQGDIIAAKRVKGY